MAGLSPELVDLFKNWLAAGAPKNTNTQDGSITYSHDIPRSNVA